MISSAGRPGLDEVRNASPSLPRGYVRYRTQGVHLAYTHCVAPVATVTNAARPLVEHVADWRRSLESKGTSAAIITEAADHVETIARMAGHFETLLDGREEG